jgi:hypothetical protein
LQTVVIGPTGRGGVIVRSVFFVNIGKAREIAPVSSAKSVSPVYRCLSLPVRRVA